MLEIIESNEVNGGYDAPLAIAAAIRRTGEKGSPLSCERKQSARAAARLGAAS